MNVKREIFYYIRNDEKKPVGTVCLISTEDNGIARGIAICSKLDPPRKQTGRNMARGRALKALMHKESSQPIRRKMIPWEFKDFYVHKSAYHVKLTDLTKYERQLLGV